MAGSRAGRATSKRKAARNVGAAKPQQASGCEPRYTLTSGDLDFLDDIVGDHSIRDVASCNASDLSTLIHNKGTADDRAAALVAIMPIARRVAERIWAS